jgi:hypothetical protein
MDIDAVIIEAEFQLESTYHPNGHFVCLKFVDTKPTHPKLNQMINDFNQNSDVLLISYKYDSKKITKDTNLEHFNITWH